MKIPVIVLTPKTASTSIRRALRYTPPSTHHVHLPLRHDKMQRRIRQESVGTRTPWVVMPVRDPIDRARSCYYFWRKRRKRSVRENVVIQEMANMLELSEFWERLDIQRISEVIPHFRTQHWFVRGCEQQVDQIIHYEDLHDNFAKLCYNLGYSDPLPLGNAWTTKELQHREALDFSDAAIDKIVNFYSVDYDKFSYQRPA